MITSTMPFVHLLSTPFAKYMFEVNRNEIVPISDEFYEMLSSKIDLSNEISNKKVAEEISDLKQCGYLSDNHVTVIEHPYSSQLKMLHERSCSTIILQVTQKCNLRCSYCVYSDNAKLQRNHSLENMSWETAKSAIDFLLEHSIDSSNINIGFYGGEPLLSFSLIKTCVNYAKKVFEGKKLNFNITTNGTLLTDQIISFLGNL